jgi:K+-sensing histidine kinase KdpD
MFTKEGVISIKENKKEKSEDDDDDNNNKEQLVVVSVKDLGIGRDPGIKAKLFSKLSIKSYHGTGLGLSKNIVEAHVAKYRAENNPDGGAVFSFTLSKIITIITTKREKTIRCFGQKGVSQY